MVAHTLRSLIVLAGLRSCFPETWDANLILHLSLLSLIAEALNCEPGCLGLPPQNVLEQSEKKPNKGVCGIEQFQSPG